MCPINLSHARLRWIPMRYSEGFAPFKSLWSIYLSPSIVSCILTALQDGSTEWDRARLLDALWIAKL